MRPCRLLRSRPIGYEVGLTTKELTEKVEDRVEVGEDTRIFLNPDLSHGAASHLVDGYEEFAVDRPLTGRGDRAELEVANLLCVS